MARQEIIIPSIDLTDMSGLRVIAHLEGNGPSQMAHKIAATLKSPKAQQVAKLLLKSGTTTDKNSKKLAAELMKASKRTPSLNGAGGRLYRRVGTAA